jgi:hypothetical protein
MTSATWPEAEAFVAAVQRTPADAVAMAAGWTAHDVLAHAVAGGAELARLLDAHLKGEPVPPTQTFEQREPAFRALSYEQLTGLLAAGGLKQSLDQMATRNTGAALDFTGWTMGATDLATHVRSELAVHRWDLVGDDELGTELLAQPELTAHAVRALSNFDVIGERLTERTRRSGIMNLNLRLRVEGQPDVMLTVEEGDTRLAITDDTGGPAIASSGAGRLLMLWGRRPAPCHDIRSNLPPHDLGAAHAWLLS